MWASSFGGLELFGAPEDSLSLRELPRNRRRIRTLLTDLMPGETPGVRA